MSIKNMILGDKNIVKAYKNNQVIFQKSMYIRMPYNSGENYGFIPVTDFELNYNYKFVIDWTTSDSAANGPNSLIGGSYSVNTSNNRYYGLFIGTEYYSSTPGRNGESLRFDSWLRSAAPICYEGSTTRHVTTFQYTGEAQTPVTRTSGGFGLFAARDYQNGEMININERSRPFASYGVDNRVFSIKIYDANDNLILHFVPQITGGHKGMYDKVHNTFYPCTNDAAFEIETI